MSYLATLGIINQYWHESNHHDNHVSSVFILKYLCSSMWANFISVLLGIINYLQLANYTIETSISYILCHMFWFLYMQHSWYESGIFIVCNDAKYGLIRSFDTSRATMQRGLVVLCLLASNHLFEEKRVSTLDLHMNLADMIFWGKFCFLCCFIIDAAVPFIWYIALNGSDVDHL